MVNAFFGFLTLFSLAFGQAPLFGQTQIGSDIDGEAARDWSGEGVVLSSDGRRVAIGAYGNDGNGEDSGHVRVYDWDDERGAWAQIGDDIDGEAAGDESGRAIAFSADGNRMAVGGLRNDGNDGYDSNRGHVRIYDWDAGKGAWAQIGDDIEGETPRDNLGDAVSLSADGSRVAIGAYGNGLDDGLNGGVFMAADLATGHVRIYDWDAERGAWVQFGNDIDGEATGDKSSYESVALSSNGNRVAIGAFRNDGNDGRDSDRGHVRVYDWNGDIWAQVGGDIDGEAEEDYSGRSIALSADGNRLAVGASYNDGDDTDVDGVPINSRRGHVRVYGWDGGIWAQVGGDIDGEAEEDYSGRSVAISADGHRLAVGAGGNDGDDTHNSRRGHVRVYDWKDGNWVQIGIDINGEAEDDWLGRAISLSSDGRRVAIGSIYNDGDDTSNSRRGHVRVYEIEAPTENEAPSIVHEIPDATIKAGAPCNLPVAKTNATDEDGDALTVRVTGLPSGLAYRDGAISGTPSEAGGHTITVTYTDTSGISVSDQFVLTIEDGDENTVLFSDLNRESIIKAYPNPASSHITIEMKEPNNYKLTVTDLIGHTVLAIGELNGLMNKNSLTVSTQQLSPGVYFLKFIGKESSRLTVKKIHIKRD